MYKLDTYTYKVILSKTNLLYFKQLWKYAVHKVNSMAICDDEIINDIFPLIKKLFHSKQAKMDMDL